jgi:hypothetical protein
MRVFLHKLSDERHTLEIVRASGEREQVECESRSLLVHDFIHLAVEEEAHLTNGFWGKLAEGKTLTEMNDRASPPNDAAMMEIERVVGALSMAAKGAPPSEVVAALEAYSTALGVGLPVWLTEPFVASVQARLRRLRGEWNATPCGCTMELAWPTDLRASGPRGIECGSPRP